ncbi:hypothetical protein EB796_018951 [Bugula neritina]|uniref:Uncharacterized protein n=1 Tax=Bugula neritina TaxID=10212 RepID=A0A7J7J9Q2_BUGNE|nr:hypothetical protein EB796_018951 [Bugula neritina]
MSGCLWEPELVIALEWERISRGNSPKRSDHTLNQSHSSFLIWSVFFTLRVYLYASPSVSICRTEAYQ